MDTKINLVFDTSPSFPRRWGMGFQESDPPDLVLVCDEQFITNIWSEHCMAASEVVESECFGSLTKEQKMNLIQVIEELKKLHAPNDGNMTVFNNKEKGVTCIVSSSNNSESNTKLFTIKLWGSLV